MFIDNYELKYNLEMHFISFNYVMWIYFETVNILGLGVWVCPCLMSLSTIFHFYF